jgi:hypothetical protein
MRSSVNGGNRAGCGRLTGGRIGTCHGRGRTPEKALKPGWQSDEGKGPVDPTGNANAVRMHDAISLALGRASRLAKGMHCLANPSA